MSLAIKTNEISDVLIDKWYKVNVFDTDAFEIGYNSDSLGKFDLTYQPTNDDSTGFIFKDKFWNDVNFLSEPSGSYLLIINHSTDFDIIENAIIS